MAAIDIKLAGTKFDDFFDYSTVSYIPEYWRPFVD